MELYKEKYFNRRNWILDNIQRLNLTSNETVVILMIDLLNEFNEKINIDILSKKCNLTKEEIDDVISSLNNKGFLDIRQQKGIYFDIDQIFKTTNNMIEDSNLYEIFEQEFGKTLSRNETNTIAEWQRIYDYSSIIAALREAIINKKMSFKYIGTILANGEKDEQS